MVQRIGRYEVVAELGRGGFGHVYRCLDPSLGTPVAVKMLHADGDAGMMVRFRNEAATSRRLTHPNIVTIYDFGEQGGVPYIVMELLEGEDLHRVIEERRPLSLLHKIGIMSQTASGLAHAHNEGIIHRDVKPANVMLLRDGTVKVMDFGIALITQSTHSRLTPRGAMIGTLRYMAPEQFRGSEPDARSDIFSYGLIFYELLCTVHPFAASEAAAQMYNILNVEPVPIRQFCPDCPPELQSTLTRLLYKDPDLRYQSLDDVLADLEPALHKLRESRSVELVREARLAKRQNHLEKAQGLIREALALTPASDAARELREQLQAELRRQAVRPRVEDLVKRAREALAAGKPTEAAQGVESAIRLDPLDATLLGLLEEARAAAERLREVQRLVAEAAAALANGDAAGAARFARTALDLTPSLTRAQEILEKAEAAQAEEKRKEQLAEDSANLRRLIEIHSWKEASELLAELNRDFPDESEVRILAEKLAAGRKKEESERKLAAGLEAASARLRDGDLPGALAGLESLAVQFPQSAEVRNRLSAVQLEVETKRHRDLVTRTLDEAQRLAAHEQFDTAVKVLDAALTQYPADAELQRERQAVVAASCDAAWRSAVQRAIAQAGALRSQARLAEAVHVLDTFLSSGGSDPAIAELRSSIEAEQESERRAAQLRDVIRRANELIGKDELDSATRLLEASPAHVRENSEITRLLDVAELQKRSRAEKKTALEALVSEVQTQCDGGHFDEALHGVDQFENRFGTDPGAGELRNRIRGERQEAQRSAEELHAQATALIASDPLQATVLLGRAPDRLRGRPEIRSLEQAARRAADEQRIREDVAERTARARALYSEGRFAEALDLLEAALKSYPGHADLTKFLSDVLAAQEREQRDLALRATINVRELKHASEFENAEGALKEALADGPEAPELLQLLANVRARHEQLQAEQAEYETAQLRREAYAQGRQRASASLRSGEFQAAITALEELLAQFPDDLPLKAELKEAREAQHEHARRERYATERRRAAGLVQARKFDDAIALLQMLLVEFADDAPLKAELKEAREAQHEHARRERYATERRRAAGLIQAGKFDDAITLLQMLLVEFPDDVPLKAELKEAREAQHERARRERYATERRRAAGLVQARKFDDAIALLRTLLVEFPADAVLEEDLKSALGARELQQQREALNREVAQLEKLYRKGDAAAVQKRASLLPADLEDPRVRELLDWARTELARPKQEGERESAESLRRKRKQRIAIGMAMAAVVAVAAILIERPIHKPPPAANESLAVDQSQLSFAFPPGATPSSKPLSLDGKPKGVHWSAVSTQPWLSVDRSQGVAPAQLTVSVDPSGLGPASYSAQLIFTTEHGTDGPPVAVNVTVDIAAPTSLAEKSKDTKPGPGQAATGKKQSANGTSAKAVVPPVQVVPTPDETKGAVAQDKTVPQSVDCRASTYMGPKTGILSWQSTEGLKPNDFLVIGGGSSEDLKGGHKTGRFPGCEVAVSAVTRGIEIVENPSPGDGYSRVKLHNSSAAPVSPITLRWTSK